MDGKANKMGFVDVCKERPEYPDHEVYINLADNASLDGHGFCAVRQVTQGMDVVQNLYAGYGQTPAPRAHPTSRQCLPAKPVSRISTTSRLRESRK